MGPDPVVCFAEARIEQRQRFDLAGSGGLVFLDAFTSGRHACGERWQAEMLQFGNEIFVDEKCVLRDVLLIEGEGFGMEAFNCFATVILLGERLAKFAAELLAWTAAQPVKRGDRLPVGRAHCPVAAQFFARRGRTPKP